LIPPVGIFFQFLNYPEIHLQSNYSQRYLNVNHLP
jgi:hypothetical protein